MRELGRFCAFFGFVSFFHFEPSVGLELAGACCRAQVKIVFRALLGAHLPKWQLVLLIPSFPEWVFVRVKIIRHNYQGVLAVWRGISRLKVGMNWIGFKTLAKYFSIYWLPQRTFCRGAVLMHKLGRSLWHFKATGTKTFCKMKRACEGARLAGIS